MILLAIPVTALVVVILHDLVRRPTLRRLALRNASRRKDEAVLVLLGSLLGTAIITASFIVGDTLGSSIRDFARTQLGPVDEAVRVAGAGSTFDEVKAALAASPGLPGTDGVLSLVRTPAAVATIGNGRRAEPNGALIEVDFDAARQFGGDVRATGLDHAGLTPTDDQAVVGRDLARRLGLRPGMRFEVFAYGVKRTLVVRTVVARRGLAGFWPARGSTSPDVFVARGTIEAMAAQSRVAEAAPPDGYVLVSNVGGVFTGASRTSAVHAQLVSRVGGMSGAEVVDLKQTLLDDADANARSFTQLFGGIGAFSVIAGVLLLVNVFVMLADERKTQLGMLRAVGLKRSHLVRAFGIEGALYSLVASAAGAVAGIGVGRVIVIVAQDIFNRGDKAFHLTMTFTASPSAVLRGFAIGAAISLVTVWFASIRIGRLNIIRAIRDLPEPPLHHSRRRLPLLLGAFGVLVGGAGVLIGASARGASVPVLAGVPLAAFSAVPLLSPFLPRRWILTVASATTIVWCIVVFEVLPRPFRGASIPTFVLQGVILVMAAVLLVTTNDEGLGFIADRMSSGRALAVRLGLAYPLHRKFRTSMLLGMYALVIFTLTFLSVFAKLFSEQGPRFTRQARAGYDVVVDSNPANPVSVDQLGAQPGVMAVAPLLRAVPEFSMDAQPEPMRWALTGFGPDLLARGQPALAARLGRFADDRAAWEAVINDSSLVIVPHFFLQHGGGPPRNALRVGDSLEIYNRATGERRRLTVAATFDSDFLTNGAMVGADFARSFLGPLAVASRDYVAISPGLDADRVAARLTGTFVEQGVDANAVSSLISTGLSQNEGFFRLMEGYLALGLLVGIAGLGVVMVRAVRERRRQIGMLRAMGFSSRVVRWAFLCEAGFVAVQGIILGVLLGLIVSYQLLSNSSVFGDEPLRFGVPWTSLLVMLVFTLAASVVASIVPASQASRTRPAVALRIAD